MSTQPLATAVQQADGTWSTIAADGSVAKQNTTEASARKVAAFLNRLAKKGR